MPWASTSQDSHHSKETSETKSQTLTMEVKPPILARRVSEDATGRLQVLAKLLYDSRGRQCLQKATCHRKSRHDWYKRSTEPTGRKWKRSFGPLGPQKRNPKQTNLWCRMISPRFSSQLIEPSYQLPQSSASVPGGKPAWPLWFLTRQTSPSRWP